MEPEFWHDRWQNNAIGFHLAQANPLLTDNLPALDLAAGSRLFLPLCGKTLDAHWLLAQGFRVAGAELSALAVEQLFTELGLSPDISEQGGLRRYAGPGIEIFQGDIFALTAETLGPVDAVYDRAALIALPSEMRRRYVPHLAALTAGVRQLLVTLVYDQSLAAGPPFSVSEDEVLALYAASHQAQLIHRQETPDGLKGKHPAAELVWSLVSRRP